VTSEVGQHVHFMLEQTWPYLSVVVAITVAFELGASRMGASRNWSHRRTMFLRCAWLFAAAIPAVSVLLGTMWFNDHALETLNNYDPYVPRWLLRLFSAMWWTELVTLLAIVIAGSQARLILIPLAMVQVVLAFLTYFTSTCAVTGSWP
jgi:hypothetical protein